MRVEKAATSIFIDEAYRTERITRHASIGVDEVARSMRSGRVADQSDGGAAFTRLEDAIYHHLHVFESARNYDPIRAGVDRDLAHLGPIEPVLERIDPLLFNPPQLTPEEFPQR